MEKLTFFYSLNSKKKRETRKILEKVKEHRKTQIATIEDTIIKYLKDNIKDIDAVLTGSMPIEFYLKRVERLRIFLNEFK